MAYQTSKEISERLETLTKVSVLTSKRSQFQAESLKERVTLLENDVQELALICHSLLTALCSQPVLNHEQFFETMKELDRSDGREDGRLDLRKAIAADSN